MGAVGIKKTHFSGIFKNSMIGVSWDLLDIFASVFLSWLTAFLLDAPWALIIFPVVMTARGDIGGIFTARITTALYTGKIEPRIVGNTRAFKEMIVWTMALTVVEIIFTSLIIEMFSMVFYPGITTPEITLAVVSAVLLLTTLESVLNTCVGAFGSFRAGIDPDAVAYPLSSAIDDIAITLIFNGVVWAVVVFRGAFIFLINWIIFPVVVLVTFFLVIRYSDSEDVRGTLRETIPVITITSVISAIGGQFLGGIENEIEKFPVILAMYPPLAALTGDETSIVSSDLTSRLSIGMVEPKITAILKDRTTQYYLLSTLLAGEIIAVINTIIVGMFLVPTTSLLMVILMMVLVNIIVVGFTFELAYFISAKTYAKDNYIIPILSSYTDMMTSITFWVLTKGFISLGLLV